LTEQGRGVVGQCERLNQLLGESRLVSELLQRLLDRKHEAVDRRNILDCIKVCARACVRARGGVSRLPLTLSLSSRS